VSNIHRHHPGWKPISESAGARKAKEGEEEANKDGKAEESSSQNGTVAEAEKKIRFGPAHRQQPLMFADLSTFWWRIMELLGFWGFI
jgi:hypothetical protein